MKGSIFIELIKQGAQSDILRCDIPVKFMLENVGTFSALVDSGVLPYIPEQESDRVTPVKSHVVEQDEEPTSQPIETGEEVFSFGLVEPEVEASIKPPVEEPLKRVSLLIVSRNTPLSVEDYGPTTVEYAESYDAFVRKCRSKYTNADTLIVCDSTTVFPKNFIKLVSRYVISHIDHDTIIGYNDPLVVGDQTMFDYGFYSLAYPEISAAGLKTSEKQRKHFLTSGVKQHRFGTCTRVERHGPVAHEHMRIIKGASDKPDVFVPSFSSTTSISDKLSAHTI